MEVTKSFGNPKKQVTSNALFQPVSTYFVKNILVQQTMTIEQMLESIISDIKLSRTVSYHVTL